MKLENVFMLLPNRTVGFGSIEIEGDTIAKIDLRPAHGTSDEVAQAPSTGGSAAQAPKHAKIDAPPKPHKTIKPDYPKGARQRGEQGEVILEIRVNAAGIVDRVDIVSSCGFPELDEAAVRAARTARFTPAKSGGSPVASTARLKLDFKLK